MSAKYAYSLNGENYNGTFDSRESAKAAALAKSSGMADPPVTVFVAEIHGGNPQATGHAKEVIDAMRRRMRETGGDEARSYLTGLTTSQMTDLDSVLTRAITAWLEKSNLMPRPSKIGAISEHPVPLPHRGLSVAPNGEVQDLGVSEYSQDAK